MAKVTFGYPLIDVAQGRASNFQIGHLGRRTRLIRPRSNLLQQPRTPTHDKRIARHWQYPGSTARFVQSPFCHYDYRIFWKKCDAFYTANPKWFRQNWPPLINARCQSAYDAWMRESLVHFYRCCDRSKFPNARPGWNVAEIERHNVWGDPGKHPPQWCAFPHTLQNYGLHYAEVQARAVYYYGPFPPYEEPPAPFLRIELGYESRLNADAFFAYNPGPRYFPGVFHQEAEMGFAVLEAFDAQAPNGAMVGSDVHSIRPFHDAACLHSFRPQWYRVIFSPPRRNYNQTVSHNEAHWQLWANVYWIKLDRPWKSHPQILGLPRGWHNDNSHSWGTNIQYGHYTHGGYDLPHNYCFYEPI